jgi:surface polysaccharide O-acyltransferase-like enzyme
MSLRTRLFSIDFLKVIAIIGVICIHTYPFAGISQVAYKAVRLPAGFAVPFFFITAGYFFALKLELSNITLGRQYLRYMKRLWLILVAWTAIYIIVPPRSFIRSGNIPEAFYQNLVNQFNRIMVNKKTVLAEGVSSHLWFIIALIVALTIITLMLKIRLGGLIIYLGAALYGFGLLAGSYSDTAIGIQAGFTTRNGPFQSVLLVGIGVLLARKNYVPTLRTALLFLGAGFVLQMAEGYILYFNFWDGVTAEYFVGTGILATGVMFLALARPHMAEGSFITSWGKYVLGIYLVHPLIIAYLPARGLQSIVWQAIFPFIVFAVSLAVTAMLVRVPYVRRIVV